MFNYLSNATPDVTDTLSINPRGTMTEYIEFEQFVDITDDYTEERGTLNNEKAFKVTIPFSALTETDADTVFDLYHNSSKANGKENSFVWQHPTDGHSYVVRFDCNLQHSRHYPQYSSYSQLTIRVLGTYNA